MKGAFHLAEAFKPASDRLVHFRGGGPLWKQTSFYGILSKLGRNSNFSVQLTPSAPAADQAPVVLGHGDSLWRDLCLSKVSVSEIGLTAWHYIFFNLKRPEGISQNTGCLYSESNAGSQKGLLAR